MHPRHEVFCDAMIEGAERWQAVDQAFSIVPPEGDETLPAGRRGLAITGVAWMRRQDVREYLIAGNYHGDLPVIPRQGTRPRAGAEPRLPKKRAVAPPPGSKYEQRCYWTAALMYQSLQRAGVVENRLSWAHVKGETRAAFVAAAADLIEPLRLEAEDMKVARPA